MLAIQLLGDFAVHDEDRPVAMDSRRARALLAYLLLHRAAPVPRARLAAAFWPDTTDAQARTDLRHVIHELRVALPRADEYLIIDRQTLGWNAGAPCRLDAAEFEAAARAGDLASLRAAAERYRGDLLPDWPDEWLAPERERLARLHEDALARLAEQLEAAGEYAAAALFAGRLARLDSAREAHAVRLMRLLALSGDRVGIQRAYHALETALRDELGLAPSADTRAERDRLLAHRAAAAPDPLPGRPAPRLARPPVPPDPLIGREADLDRVVALLGRRRLLTLMGFGGVGKTRLALAAAVAAAPAFPDGVAWADLRPLGRGEPVAAAVAAALGETPADERPLEDALVDAVGDRKLLLALDNCEHVTAGVVELAGRLLGRCPGLVVLATSRTRLRLPGEALYPVSPLATPAAAPAEPNGDAASVRLFAARAAAARPSFRLSAENAAVVADICRRLEGIPLAIELAAARARDLSPEEIAARLDETWRVATPRATPSRSGRRDTLWAAIDWSHALLSLGEQALLRRLSLFAGSFDLEAAESVAGDDAGPVRRADVLGLLSSLIDHSLVGSEEAPDRYRYRLHASTRDYAAARLAAAGERDAALARYAAHYLALIETPTDPPEARWATLSVERPNLPAALEWARAQEAWELAGRLSVGLGDFWAVTGDHRRGREWLAETLRHEADLSPRLRAEALRAMGTLEFEAGQLERAGDRYAQALDAFRPPAGDEAARADLLGRLGHVAQLRGDYDAADARYRQALAAHQALGDARGAALITNRLAHVAYYRGDLDEARALLERALATREALDDRRGLASTLNGLGELARAAGRLDEAADRYERALALCREMDDRRCIAGIEHNLGHVALRRGRYDEARARFAASLAVYAELEHRGGIALSLYGLAGAVAGRGRPADAARLMGAADALAETAGLVHGPADGEALEAQRGALRAALGSAGFDAAAAEGRAMGWQAVAELA